MSLRNYRFTRRASPNQTLLMESIGVEFCLCLGLKLQSLGIYDIFTTFTIYK